MPFDDRTTAWINKLKALAFDTPFAGPVKITVGVTPRVGERLALEAGARLLLGGMDAQGRPTLAVDVAGDVVTIEWLAPHAQPTLKDDPLPPTRPTSD
jgi:hypothetical protein